MAAFMGRVGYDTLYDFGEDRAHHDPDFMISSWGAREEYTIEQIEHWLDRRGAASPAAPGPFFLNYLTAATHHPYGVPAEYPGPFPGVDGLARYRNSLHYTDTAIGRLLDALARRGLLAETIVAITGDHGQAFGDIHPMNFTHRNRLYEENIKSFLILVPPVPLPGPVVSHRVASIGDIMPTLLAVAGLAGADVPGRSLLGETYAPRPAFFHKDMQPEQWGLRHGAWKYIGRIRDRSAELYNLANDPDEQVNLAGQDRGRVARYDAACEQLFIRREAEFTARLEGYRPTGLRSPSQADLCTPGPEALTMGIIREVGGARRFVERGSFQPGDRPTARVRWVPHAHDSPLEFCWRSPSGREYRQVVTILPGSTFADCPLPGNTSLQAGRWTISIREPATGRDLLCVSFQVGLGAVSAPRPVP
jgi:hypothetical protein